MTFSQLPSTMRETDVRRLRAHRHSGDRIQVPGHLATLMPFGRVSRRWFGLVWPVRLRSDGGEKTISWLWQLAGDESPRVRVDALLSLKSQIPLRKSLTVDADILIENLGHPDHRVRLAATWVLALLPEEQQDSIERRILPKRSPRLVTSLLVAHNSPDRTGKKHVGDYLHDALEAMERAESPADRLDAMRAIMLSLGDWNLAAPKLELFQRL